MLYVSIVIVLMLACAGLVLLVVIQNSKGGGLATNLQTVNAATQMFGTRRAADLVEKLTWWFVGIMTLLTFVANFVAASGGLTTGEDKKSEDLLIKAAVQNAPTTVPAPNAFKSNTLPAGASTDTNAAAIDTAE